MSPHNRLIDWSRIRTVLLDMDGTLLDLHFDEFFFTQTVPLAYARHHQMAHEVARQQVLQAYQSEQGRLQWYDLNYWSQQFGFDLALLKQEVAHLIQMRPHTLAFLQQLHAVDRLTSWLVTNAHTDSLNLKLQCTPIAAWFDGIVTSHELGWAKEQADFWPLLQQRIGFDPTTTLLIDDAEVVLHAAARYGIGQLIHIAAPNSSAQPVYSKCFTSIDDFDVMMPVE
ncbi:MAG: HAD hydrolase-like protein [Magnetococcales bacterium]|nr:HAD hydrolase-like protein [Magnetococcales bacterium]